MKPWTRDCTDRDDVALLQPPGILGCQGEVEGPNEIAMCPVLLWLLQRARHAQSIILFYAGQARVGLSCLSEL